MAFTRNTADPIDLFEATGTSPPRGAKLSLTPNEAAYALGVGRTFFYEHVLPDLAVVRKGRKRLIPIRELERWLARHAERLPRPKVL